MYKNELHEVFIYKSGSLYWRKNVSNVKAGNKAGCKDAYGYTVIRYKGRLEKAHRLIWCMHYGSIDKGKQIDHINGLVSDNRLNNLRLVDHKENGRNQKLRNTNTSGVTGVYWSKSRNKWIARITVDGCSKSLGYFTKLVAATKARKNAEREYGFHHNHGRKV